MADKMTRALCIAGLSLSKMEATRGWASVHLGAPAAYDTEPKYRNMQEISDVGEGAKERIHAYILK